MTRASQAKDSSGQAPEPISLGRIELFNVALVLITALGCWGAWGGERGVGVLIGGALSAASFRTVVVVMKRIVSPQRTGWWPVAVFWLKYMAMIGLVGVLIMKYRLDVIGFLVGVTLIVPSILMEAVRKGMAREEQGK